MMTEPRTTSRISCIVYFIGIGGALLIVALLNASMNRHVRPPALNAARSSERLKARQELDAQTSALLRDYSWADQAKGIVRLPIERSMQMMQEQWQNPAAGRSNLLARLEKATAQPPKAPEKPSQFE